jgi:hypothetical protein
MAHQTRTWESVLLATLHTTFFSAELLPMDEAICSAVISLEIKISLFIIPFTHSKFQVTKE